MRLLVLLILLITPRIAVAASKADPSGIAYEQRLGAAIPLQRIFRDDTGGVARLGDLVDGKPFVLVLGYFHCPNLCGVVRADLFDALRNSGLRAGRDYSLAALSIDPSESSADAAAAKASDLLRYPTPGAERNWHFLTGTADETRAISEAVGFHGRPEPDRNQFPHPVGVIFVTSQGVISSYLLGVGYQPDDVRLAVARSARGDVAPAASPVLLLCYDFDLTTGKLTLSIMKLLRVAAAGTTIAVVGMVYIAFRRGRQAT
jgi:protein SCO1